MAPGRASCRCFCASEPLNPNTADSPSSDSPSSDSQQVIGIDLGGTAIKLARFNRQGALQAELSIETPQPAVPGAVTVALCEAIDRLDPMRLAGLVGVGCPGPWTPRPGWPGCASPCRVGTTCLWPTGLRLGLSVASPWPTTAIVPWWGKPGVVRRRASVMWCCSLWARVWVAA